MSGMVRREARLLRRFCSLRLMAVLVLPVQSSCTSRISASWGMGVSSMLGTEMVESSLLFLSSILGQSVWL
jgi:hypothetical protein